jgi:hypothetical protein
MMLGGLDPAMFTNISSNCRATRHPAQSTTSAVNSSTRRKDVLH